MRSWTLLFLICLTFSCNAQKNGCTDSLALNFDQEANVNNGSCIYKSKTIKPELIAILPNTLKESSGLSFWKGTLWSHNDDHDPNLYSLNTKNGEIQKIINIPKVTNKDWEELSQDSTYFYIADTGNNIQGNRKDLHFLRISKQSILDHNLVVDTLYFNYENQLDYAPQIANKTNFDMEAFVVSQDSIYLFTKEWNSKKTTLYSLPKTPGKYCAKLRGTLNVKGLITGATYNEKKHQIVLCGYTKTLQPFLYLLYNFSNYNFFSGNKRKIKLKLAFHQIEGIATSDDLHFYLSNESLNYKGLIKIPAALWEINLSDYLKQKMPND